MVTEGSYPCGEPSIMYRVVKSLCCTLAIDVILCVNYSSIKKKKKEVLRISRGSRSDQYPNKTKSHLWFYSSLTKCVANSGKTLRVIGGVYWDITPTNSFVLSKENARGPLGGTGLHRDACNPLPEISRE